MLDYVRIDYNAGVTEEKNKIKTAEDDPYLLSNMEKAIGLVPTIAEDGTEVYPEVIGCPVHSLGFPFYPGYPYPEYPYLDPNDPNYMPPVTGEEGDTPLIPGVPEEPSEPDTPVEDPTGGFGDADADWWGALGM